GARGHGGHHPRARHRDRACARRPVPHGRQDRHRAAGWPARGRAHGPAQPALPPAPPGAVHRLRPGRGSADRGGGDRGARRLRRRHRGAHRAPHLRRLAVGARIRANGGRPRGRRCQRGRWAGGRIGGGAMNVILGWLLDLWGRFTRTLDWPLLGALCALMGIGLAVLHSASGQNAGMVAAQAVRYGVGLAAMWLLSRVTPLRLRAVTPAFYALSIIPLVVVLFLGTGRHGQHWLNLGVFYFQPAQLMKLSLPMMAAWYLNIAGPPPRPAAVLACLAIIALPTGLIMLQPDLGTAVLVAASGLFALYLAGLSWGWFAAVAGAVAAAAPAAWFWMLQP